MENTAMLPEKNPEAGEFTSAREAVAAFAQRTAGKKVVVTDLSSCGLAARYAPPRSMTVVLEEDALPLFAIPSAGAAIAVGSGRTLVACRFFAEVMRIPCLILPVGATLDGVYGRTGEVLLDGVLRTVPLETGETVLDKTLLAEHLHVAQCRVLLARLGLFETRMLARFGLRTEDAGAERACAALLAEAEDLEGLVRQNMVLRRCEAEGMPCGEGILFARMLGGTLPEYAAFSVLFRLYSAFFRVGTPRRFTVPDYRRRAAKAGVPYGDLFIPTVEELARREEILGRVRDAACAGLREIGRAEARFLRKYRPVRSAQPIGCLPERSGGLSALIRDFGLLEFA